MSVLDNIMVGRHHLLKNNFITGSLYWLTGARREELEHRRKVEEIIDFLDLQSVRKATAGTLPYGLRKRVELARAMALEPQLILLDEPMAGMNFEEKEDMARYIVDLNEEFGMTVMMIEHDMGVVMDISHRVMVLDFGRKIAEGEPAAVLADPHVKRAYLGEEDEVLVDPDDKPAAAGVRGMMDYAGRVAQADTYPKLLRLNAREHGGEIALREKDLGLWRVFTWNDYQARVHDFALGMVELGLGRGDVIGIIGDNRPDWVAAEIATHAIGAMSLGLYRDVLDEEAAYLLSYGEAKLVFAEDEEQVDKLLGPRRPRAESEAHRLFRSARHAKIRRSAADGSRASSPRWGATAPRASPASTTGWWMRPRARTSRSSAPPRAPRPIPSSRCSRPGACCGTARPISRSIRRGRTTNTSRCCRCPGSWNRSTRSAKGCCAG